MKILNRLTGETLFESAAAETMRQAVLDAIMQDADLSDANLRGANLRGANLRGADLSGADLIRADLIRADMAYADLSDANLSGAALTYADLSDANLRGANLSDANLRGANLSGADLIRANLSGVILPVLQHIQKAEIRAAICAQVCAAPEKLEMSRWHTCDTVHCIAGWAVTLHPQGRLLESIYGTSTAAALILWVCEGEIPDFHTDNETALRWIRGEKEEV